MNVLRRSSRTIARGRCSLGGAAPPRPPLVASITVIAQRQTIEDAILAQLDALDISAASYDGGGTGQGSPDFEE